MRGRYPGKNYANDTSILKYLAGYTYDWQSALGRKVMTRALERLGVTPGWDLLMGTGAKKVTPEMLQKAVQEALDHYGYYTKQAGYPGAWTPGNVAAALRRLRAWPEHMDDPSDFEEEADDDEDDT